MLTSFIVLFTRDPMELKDCINDLTHSLLQQGDDMRQRTCGAPPSATKNLTSTTSGDSGTTQADAKNQPFTKIPGAHAGTPHTPASALTLMGLYHQEVAFKRCKREYTLKVHQSMPMLARGTGDKNGSGSE
jgi:hypothetical protein